MDFGKCSRCRGDRDRPGHAYCRACHAAYAREHRVKHSEMPEEKRRRATCRAYANVYRRRGKLIPAPCEKCGVPEVQMHHDDYSQPLAVRWLCFRHHRELTAAARG